jgi:2,4-dienoyl-CoA reductase (NADPH2)
MVSLARAMLSDAEFANKAKAGDRAGINICIACNQACLDHYFIGQPASCVVNPRAGRETTLNFLSTRKRKTIAVVGGGPAGLSCAAVAAERGHAADVVRARRRTGRPVQPREENSRRQEFAESVAYYGERLRRAGASVLLNHAATEAELARFDEVILRPIEPRKPEIPGIDHRSVTGYVDLLSRRAQAGKNVVIIGAGGSASMSRFSICSSARAALRWNSGRSTGIGFPRTLPFGRPFPEGVESPMKNSRSPC